MQELFTTQWSEKTKHHANIWQVFQSYIQLTKPRIIVLLLVTTLAAVFVASEGRVDPVILIASLVGGTLASASANTMNCLYDRDIDWQMERTRDRPLPSGRIQPRDALIFAIALAVSSFSLLTVFANVLAASLAMAGIVFYVLIYTHFLKRHSSQNIVIGGAAGSIPPLVGWAAVTGELSWAPWVMFWIIFIWTPPHFWALALNIKDDYASVGVPMLPVVRGAEETARQIWLYAVVLVPFSLLLVFPLGVSSWLYAALALVLGERLLQKCWLLLREPEDQQRARSLFKFSIAYMMLLAFGMAIDSLPIVHTVGHWVIDSASNLPTVLSALG
ncbi:MAG: heme o synthase [Cyanobacteria bacterium P01_D01_bin.73]